MVKVKNEEVCKIHWLKVGLSGMIVLLGGALIFELTHLKSAEEEKLIVWSEHEIRLHLIEYCRGRSRESSEFNYECEILNYRFIDGRVVTEYRYRLRDKVNNSPVQDGKWSKDKLYL